MYGHLFSSRAELLLVIKAEVETEGQEISYSEWWMDSDGMTRMRRAAVAGRKWLLRHSCTEPGPPQESEKLIMYSTLAKICGFITHRNGGSVWSPILLHSCNWFDVALDEVFCQDSERDENCNPHP